MNRKTYDHFRAVPTEVYVFDTHNGQFKGIGTYEDYANADYMPSLKPFTDMDWHSRWPNFPKEEMRSRDSKGDLIISVRLMDALQVWRTQTDVPMRIRSGYRTREHNASIPGSAKNSMHCYGIAVDIDVSNQNIINLRQHLRKYGFEAFGAYPDDDFLHADLGPAAEFGNWKPWRANIMARFKQEKEPVTKQKKKNMLNGIGTAVAATPPILNGVAGLDLPQWLVAGAFVVALAFIGIIIWRNK